MQNEAYATKFRELVEHGLIKLDGHKPDPNMFAEVPKKLLRTDRTWLAEWLVRHFGGKLTAQQMRVQDERYEQFVFEVARMFFCMTGTETFPEEAKNKIGSRCRAH